MFDIDTLAGKEQVLELALAKTQYYCDVEEDPKNIFTHLDRYIKKVNTLKIRYFQVTGLRFNKLKTSYIGDIDPHV